MDERIDFERKFSLGTMRVLHFFVTDTVNKIFRHIDRLKIKRTSALKDSIKAVVHTNSGGNEALAQFFYLNYGDCVEQAVGKYYGVDADLGKGVGVKSENISAPEITGSGYGAMTASFNGLPANARREKTHKPRPFLRSEIRRQVERVSFKLMKESGILIDIHITNLIGEEIGGEIGTLLKAPFAGRKSHKYQYEDTIKEAGSQR